MIVFDLICHEKHRFEVWFRSSSEYESQKKAGFLECPQCGSQQVSKALTAPRLGVKSNQKADRPPPPAREGGGDGGDGIKLQKTGEALAGRQALERRLDGVPEKRPEAPGVPLSIKLPERLKKEMRQFVEKNFENVGRHFAEEARKIHYGEAAERPIVGTATGKQVAELLDEGLDILPVPDKPKLDA